ncbi:MAG: nucleotidyltransferase domain-containing protein [Anaerolineae bacterium]|nr:nucleotidyltransferase domain-containing protein [Anaerolineae bacterium]
MGKTALELTDEELKQYHPAARLQESTAPERWAQAWHVAQAAAELLRREFGATRVVAFGSLAHRAWFTQWSDIDLAAWGIPPDQFYRAVAVVTGLSAEFEINLVSPEDVHPSVRRAIEREGVDL